MKPTLLNAWLRTHAGTIGLILRLGLGVLFICASLDKIQHPGLFAKAISNYRILPLPFLHLTAIVLPWLELLTGLALILNRFPRAANLLLGGMLLIFTMGIISAMARGLDFNCGCFDLNAEASNMGLWKVLQNVGLLLSVYCLDYLLRMHPQKG
jgi:uncharacterized membrane protein YphA (DoxX/SURF4 family)